LTKEADFFASVWIFSLNTENPTVFILPLPVFVIGLIAIDNPDPISSERCSDWKRAVNHGSI